jgi:hypothetical protein
MEKNYLTKEEAAKILTIPGNVKGTIILTNLEYLKKKGGEEALEKLKERIKELEIPIDLENVKHANMYPEAISVLIVLLIKEILNLNENDIFEMGGAAMKLSPVTKILTKFFLSFEVVLKKASEYWKEYFDFGELEIVDYDKEKKYTIIRLKGYKFHPLLCIYHAGYFYQVAKMALGSPKIIVKETKCTFRGDPFDEFYFSWE